MALGVGCIVVALGWHGQHVQKNCRTGGITIGPPGI
jgi:hypothetical protein